MFANFLKLELMEKWCWSVEEGLRDLVRIGKNVKLLKVLHAKDLNVYDLLWCEKLVISRGELQQVQDMWV